VWADEGCHRRALNRPDGLLHSEAKQDALAKCPSPLNLDQHQAADSYFKSPKLVTSRGVV
jgi:hypothetical protein